MRILAFSDTKAITKEGDCIHCGRCVGVCPMQLMPNYLAQFSKLGDKSGAEEFNILSCVECGTCTYICPGNVPIVQYIRTTKGAILADKKKAASVFSFKILSRYCVSTSDSGAGPP